MKMTSKNHQKKSENFLDLSSMITNVPSEFLEKVVIWTTLAYATDNGLKSCWGNEFCRDIVFSIHAKFACLARQFSLNFCPFCSDKKQYISQARKIFDRTTPLMIKNDSFMGQIKVDFP